MSRVKIKGVLVLLPNKLVKNNIFQRFYSPKNQNKIRQAKFLEHCLTV
jgi:hypothetical protein